MKRNHWMITSIAAGLLFSGCGLQDRIPAEMVSIDQSRPLGNEKSLRADVQFDIGSLEIAGADESVLYSYSLEYDKASYRPEVNYETMGEEEGNLSLRLKSLHRVGIRSERRSNRLHLNLNDSVPLRLRINTGVGDTRLSLSRLKLERLDLEAGVGGAKISAYDPNPLVCERIKLQNGVGSLEAVGLGNLNFRRLDFEGGVGGATLDFSGNWKADAEVSIEVGIGGVTLRMPRNVGVRVEAEKNFLSGLHLEGFRKEGSDYYSDDYEQAPVKLRIRVETGIGGFKITWI